MGDWKLSAEMSDVKVRDRGGIDPNDQKAIKTAELGKMELYDLSNDIAETTNLKNIETGRFKQMRTILLQSYRQVQSESPTWPEWDFARYEAQRILWPSYRGSRRIPARLPDLLPKYLDNPHINTIE